jgi:bla regulator protein blaR1
MEAHGHVSGEEDLSEHLNDAQLEAILAHELWHVRRRDNLAALVHMVVEAVFWFHPLIWWLGGRLVEERERACDEEVLEMGGERQAYAVGILKTCEFYVGSPLACVSGVTGSDLKKRVVRIMTESVGGKLNFRRKMLLGVSGLLAVALPVGFGLGNPGAELRSAPAASEGTPPKFKAVTIKLFDSGPMGRRYGYSITDPPHDGMFYATDVTAERLVQMAYGVRYRWLILGAPSWLGSKRFDIQASADTTVNDQLKKLSQRQGLLMKHSMLQALLLKRFGLVDHREVRRLPVYGLVVAKSGPKLKQAKPGDIYANGINGAAGRVVLHADTIAMEGTSVRVTLTGHAISIDSVVSLLMDTVDRPVLDQTGLADGYDTSLWDRLLMDLDLLHRPVSDQTGLRGKYDISLHWTSEVSGPSIFAALQQQLGLRLKPEKRPVGVLVIDHVQQPTPN